MKVIGNLYEFADAIEDKKEIEQLRFGEWNKVEYSAINLETLLDYIDQGMFRVKCCEEVEVS